MKNPNTKSKATSTPTERRGYNLPFSRLVATSLCRGAAGPSALLPL
jgi:hypothetical protein